jgi:hypothetical protein
MHEFSELLISVSRTMGTVLDVANLLEADPPLVYRWMAGLERPAPATMRVYTVRLRTAGQRTLRMAAHPRRRAADARASF